MSTLQVIYFAAVGGSTILIGMTGIERGWPLWRALITSLTATMILCLIYLAARG